MIKRLKPKSEFGRNVLTLLTGTTVAQIIPMASMPILTRLYVPEEFGEAHRYVLLLASSKQQARAKARKYALKTWQQPHVDAVLDVDDCILIDQVDGHFVHLVEGSHNGVRFENCYLVI